jgi:ferredoxin
MIVARAKPFEAVLAFLAPYRRVALVGCKGCVTVCAAGGTREVGILATTLALEARRTGRALEIVEVTLERQCDPEYVASLGTSLEGVEAILSLACGAGVQHVASRYALPVYPGNDTLFIGVVEQPGQFQERCRACGDCQLGVTAGVCPVSRCAKRLRNGPCGGSSHGHCELGAEVPCAWQAIVDRLESLGRLDDYERLLAPADGAAAPQSGPRRLDREDLR